MTDYRIYLRTTAAGFDFATPETAIYTQLGFGWTTPTQTAVGIFDPAALGRQRETASLVNIFSDTAAVPGDIVAVISPSGTVRQTAPFRPQGSGWLLALPDDQIGIQSILGRQAELFVNDLDDIQLNTYISNTACCEPVFPPFECTTITMSTPGAVPAFSGEMIVFTDFDVPGAATLPPLPDVPECSNVTFIRIGGAVPTITTDAPGDQVNGSTAATFTPYPIRSLNESVKYKRVQSGWQRDLGTQASPIVVELGPVMVIPPSAEGTQYCISGAVGLASALLPSLTLTREGFRVCILNISSDELTVVPDGTDVINGNIDTYIIPTGGTAWFEVSRDIVGVGQWFAIEQNEDPRSIVSLGPALVLNNFRGFGMQRVEIGGDCAVTLPPATSQEGGASVLVTNGGEFEVTVAPDVGDQINGVFATPVNVKKNRSTLFVHGNSGNTGWNAVDGFFQPVEQIEAGGLIVMFTWVDSPKIVEAQFAAGAQIQLPLASTVSYGATALIWNNSAAPATLLSAVGDDINGILIGVAIAPGIVAQVTRRTLNTSWLALNVV